MIFKIYIKDLHIYFFVCLRQPALRSFFFKKLITKFCSMPPCFAKLFVDKLRETSTKFDVNLFKTFKNDMLKTSTPRPFAFNSLK